MHTRERSHRLSQSLNRPEASWGALERLLRDLEESRGTVTTGTHSLVRAIRDGLGADHVFLFDGDQGEVVGATGRSGVTPPWGRDLAGRLLREAAPRGNELVWADPDPNPDAAAGPHAAAMVRVSKSRSVWLVAVSLRPGREFTPQDLRVMSLGNQMLANHRRQARTYVRLKEALHELIRCLTAAIDAKDPYTCGHSERVARIAVRLGRQMALPDEIQSDLYLGGLLHDVGKIGVLDVVLHKPGRLTAEEYEHVQQHTVIGDRIVAEVKQLAYLRPAVRNHHERYDGRGYPDGLAGEAIPLVARVLAVADACDAMMSTRPYRPAMAPAAIDGIMAEGAGTHWDPVVVQSFLACRADAYAVCQQGIGESLYAAIERAAERGASAHLMNSLVARS